MSAGPASSPRWDCRRRVRAVSGVLLVAAIAAIAALAWVWRHPTSPFDGAYGLKSARAADRTMWSTLVAPIDQAVTIRGLEPRMVTVNGDAEVEYVVCVLDEDTLARDRVTSFGYGVGARDLARYCASTRPAVGATIGADPEVREEVVVGVTRTTADKVAVRGHRVDYRVGWQWGSDTIPVTVVLTTPR